MNIFIGELVGTMILVLLGDGVVANVVLKNSKAHDSGWIVIATGWGLAVCTARWMLHGSWSKRTWSTTYYLWPRDTTIHCYCPAAWQLNNCTGWRGRRRLINSIARCAVATASHCRIAGSLCEGRV